MRVIIAVHHFVHEGKMDSFRAYESKALQVFRHHGGKILATFQPEGAGKGGIPDEIHVLSMPSLEGFDAYQEDPGLAALKPQRAEAIQKTQVFRSALEHPYEHGFATLLSNNTPKDPEKITFGTELLQEQSRETYILPSDLDGPLSVPEQQDIDTLFPGVADRTQNKLESLVRTWQGERDRRVVFAHTYLLMTNNMRKALEADEFIDPNWVRPLLEHFAGFYFKALKQYRNAWFSAPPVWRTAFQVAENPQTFTGQHLFLGMNAHINNDLVLTLIDMLKGEWSTLSFAGKKERYEDHTYVNQVIARTMDATQQEIINRYSPLLDAINRISFNLDDLLVSRLITSWRDQVWKQAVRYLETEDLDERHAILQNVEYVALRRADTIMLKRGPFKMEALA